MNQAYIDLLSSCGRYVIFCAICCSITSMLQWWFRRNVILTRSLVT